MRSCPNQVPHDGESCSARTGNCAEHQLLRCRRVVERREATWQYGRGLVLRAAQTPVEPSPKRSRFTEVPDVPAVTVLDWVTTVTAEDITRLVLEWLPRTDRLVQ